MNPFYKVNLAFTYLSCSWYTKETELVDKYEYCYVKNDRLKNISITAWHNLGTSTA